MKYLKSIYLVENYKNKPNVDSLSPKFWEMVDIINWQEAINLYRSDNSISSYNQEKRDNCWEKMQFRLYSKYDYSEIINFLDEYYFFYIKLYDYFNEANLLINIIDGDDYSDALSSVIGKGKSFTKECIDNKNKFTEMVNEEDYIENFKYLLDINFDEYENIKVKYDPFYREVKKYNL